MAGKVVYYENFFKDINIQDPSNKEWIQAKFLANKVYLNDTKASGDIFRDMVMNGSAWTVRREKNSKYIELVPSIDDRRFIELYFDHKEDYVRAHALKKIENEFILAYVAINDENRQFRWNAFNRVWDEGLLREIALNSCDWELRFTVALHYLKDAKILNEIAENCPDSDLSQRARECADKFGPLTYKTYAV